VKVIYNNFVILPFAFENLRQRYRNFYSILWWRWGFMVNRDFLGGWGARSHHPTTTLSCWACEESPTQ